MHEEDFTSTGGVRTHMRSWSPAGTPRGALAICHGVNLAWRATCPDGRAVRGAGTCRFRP